MNCESCGRTIAPGVDFVTHRLPLPGEALLIYRDLDCTNLHAIWDLTGVRHASLAAADEWLQDRLDEASRWRRQQEKAKKRREARAR